MMTERVHGECIGLDRWVNTRVVVIDWLITELLAAGPLDRRPQQFGGLLKSEIVWARAGSSSESLVLHTDGLEKERFALHLHVEPRHVPVPEAISHCLKPKTPTVCPSAPGTRLQTSPPA